MRVSVGYSPTMPSSRRESAPWNRESGVARQPRTWFTRAVCWPGLVAPHHRESGSRVSSVYTTVVKPGLWVTEGDDAPLSVLPRVPSSSAINGMGTR